MRKFTIQSTSISKLYLHEVEHGLGKNWEYILQPVRCRGNPEGNLTFPEAQTAIDSIQIYDRE